MGAATTLGSARLQLLLHFLRDGDSSSNAITTNHEPDESRIPFCRAMRAHICGFWIHNRMSCQIAEPYYTCRSMFSKSISTNTNTFTNTLASTSPYSAMNAARRSRVLKEHTASRPTSPPTPRISLSGCHGFNFDGT
jgi:hypothetical protein